MLVKLKKKIRSLTHLIWLCLLIIITVSVTYFYESNKKSQYDYLRKTLNNVFLLKTFSKITSELENRFIEREKEENQKKFKKSKEIIKKKKIN